mmetsp:Transcript_56261/g.148470  ORF Transcript_56261/g.148470 Transcript_56261/m.148470 type:complete len:95 (-) Transcript_56261:80-364(-)
MKTHILQELFDALEQVCREQRLPLNWSQLHRLGCSSSYFSAPFSVPFSLLLKIDQVKKKCSLLLKYMDREERCRSHTRQTKKIIKLQFLASLSC